MKYCSKKCQSKQWARKNAGWTPPLPRGCTVCGRIFTPDNFHPKAKCCSNACRNKALYAENKEARKTYVAAWIKRNPDKYRAYHRTHYANHIVEKRIQKKVRRSASVSKDYFLAMCADQKFRCKICEQEFTASFLSIDHIFPVSRGGTNAKENLHVLCLTCNQKKGSKIIYGLYPTIPS